MVRPDSENVSAGDSSKACEEGFDKGTKLTPEKTASTTSSVATHKSKGGSLSFRVLSGFEDSRTVLVFFNFLVETFLSVSLIFE
jgi:hypothetical protein